MPKLRDTPKTRMDRAFMAALRYGQAMRGETDKDTMRLMPKSTATYYKRLHNLDGFTREEIENCHMPIGTAIGAETPAEIAVSIAGELIHIRALREGRRKC